jgi:excisionase family DNA binding protein
MLIEADRQPTEVSNLLTLRDVKDYLGVSYGVVLGQIRDGKLRAYKVTGDPVRREEVHDGVYGLRIRPEDLEDYLDNVEVQ